MYNCFRPKNLQRFLFLVCFALLYACSGSDGDDGAAGQQGTQGNPYVVNDAAEAVTVIINAVNMNGAPVVEFSAVDEKDQPFTGLAQGSVRFTLAKLVSGSSGDSDYWQSYVNKIEAAGGTGTGIGTGAGTEDKVQATYDNNGTLVNHNDGSYTYTFETDVTSVTAPITVAYEPALVHRLAMQLSGDFAADNPIYTFVPESGATDNLNQKRVVKTQSCNECHGKLALHGGGRTEVEYCVTCHNSGSSDANSGNTIDFNVMVHKIHRGASLPSVVAGGDYTIYGYRNAVHDYSDVHYPQRISHCRKCHDENDSDTPQAGNWQSRPSIAACGSCHDDVDFSAGVAGGHGGGVVTDNSECTTCHASNRNPGSVAESHANRLEVESAKYAFNIIRVTHSAPGQFPAIKYSVTDPSNNNAAYTLQENVWSGGARLSIVLAWDTQDYHNESSGSYPGKPVSINALNGTDNNDGTFSVTSSVAIPSTVTGSGAVAIEGHPVADLDGDGTFSDSVPVTSVVDYFSMTDTSAVERREVVSLEKCQSCHGVLDGLSLHGGNRSDNIGLCVMCHNPNATDLAMRPTDPDGLHNGTNSAALGSKEEESIDFKYLIHGIHASAKRENNLIVYGYFNSAHDFSDVRYPVESNNCTTCHVDDSYALPLVGSVLATTVDTGGTVKVSSPYGSSNFVEPAAVADPADDKNIGPTAAACFACHDGSLEKAHMQQNGSSFSALQSDFDDGALVETCYLCHGPGRLADVKTAHQVD